MTNYRISGVWKNNNDIITHYAMHTVEGNTVSRTNKTSKTEAIQLLETFGNAAVTWIWNYNQCKWNLGENVQVVNGTNGKYLRSNPDNKLTDNLMHLIDYDWIAP